MTSNTPQPQSTNPLEIARMRHVAAGLPLLDLSDGNPTQHGLSLDWHDLQHSFLKYVQVRKYQPDARGQLEARKSIVRYYAQRSPALELTADQIVITASTSEGYSLLLSLLCKPGDTILEPEITYPLFELISSARSVNRRMYRSPPLDLCQPSPISSDLLTGIKAFFAISPHNPCGTVLKTPQAELDNSKIPIIVDEVFSEFTSGEYGVPPAGVLYPNNPVFHLNGISKMCGLPDFKIGWIAMNACASKMYGEQLEFLNDIYLSASYPIQHLLPEILAQRQRYRTLVVTRIQENLAIFEELTRTTERLCPYPYQAGATLFPRIETNMDQEIFLLSLLDRGISVHPGYYYNWERDFRIAISLILEPATFREGIQILCDHVTACE